MNASIASRSPRAPARRNACERKPPRSAHEYAALLPPNGTLLNAQWLGEHRQAAKRTAGCILFLAGRQSATQEFRSSVKSINQVHGSEMKNVATSMFKEPLESLRRPSCRHDATRQNLPESEPLPFMQSVNDPADCIAELVVQPRHIKQYRIGLILQDDLSHMFLHLPCVRVPLRAKWVNTFESDAEDESLRTLFQDLFFELQIVHTFYLANPLFCPGCHFRDEAKHQPRE